jgi:hypothetical protein
VAGFRTLTSELVQNARLQATLEISRLHSARKALVICAVTREELLSKLEARLAETLQEYGITATVVTATGDAGALPVSLGTAPGHELPEEVLGVLQDAVRDFVTEYQLEFACLFGPRPDPSLLN